MYVKTSSSSDSEDVDDDHILTMIQSILVVVPLIILSSCPTTVESLQDSSLQRQSLPPPQSSSLTRRDVFTKASTAAAAAAASAAAVTIGQSKSASATAMPTKYETSATLISTLSLPETSSRNPPPKLLLPRGRGSDDDRPVGDGGAGLNIPRVGYSLYKTPIEQVERSTALALRAGVRYFDVATQYGTNREVGKVLQLYLSSGLEGLEEPYHVMTMSDEKTESSRIQVLQAYQDAAQRTEERLRLSTKKGFNFSGLRMGRRLQQQQQQQQRRDEIFISHKLSNSEQSDDFTVVRECVLNAMNDLLGARDNNSNDVDGGGSSNYRYLDMVSIHSPLSSKTKRLGTYRTLLNMKDEGLIRAVGVCNYGLGPLKEILDAGLPLPDVNQIELSPFNTHSEIVQFCDQHGIAVCCSAWSRLSSQDGPVEQWDTLSRIAASKKMTKAQLLVKWALQKGYLCVPRSSSGSKVERLAICENSYGGTIPQKMITDDEMNVLDELNVDFKSGTLKRVDGWDLGDISSPDWDPTEVV